MNLEKLESFLIENSNISKEFIKDFFGFQKTSEFNKHKPFVISLDDIAFWLDINKDKIQKTLFNNYIKNIDYKILLPFKGERVESHGGHNKKLILLIPDCFKLLCMRSRTEKAEKVRKYYIDIEKLIDSYKDTIINNQNKKISILENDMKKEKYPKGGYCYIFEEIDNIGEKYYRIGQSQDMNKRMANHNSSNIHKKIVIFKIKTSNILHYENCLRGSMYDFRYKNNKDYYKLPFDKLKYAVQNCKNITIKLKNDQISDDQTGGTNINIKNSDESITKLFSKAGEDVRWNFYRKPCDAYYNGKKITEKKLNEVVLPKSYLTKNLIVYVHRFGEYMEIIDLGYKEITYKKLFSCLYNFYNKSTIGLNQLKKIPNDVDDCVKDAITKAKTGKKVYKKELIGGLNRFEGIKEITQSLYILKIGS